MSAILQKSFIKFFAIIFIIASFLFAQNEAGAAVSIRNVGAWVSGTSNLNPAIPGTAGIGDMMLLAYGTKPYSDAPTIDQGWVSIGSATDGTVASSGNDVGSM